MVPRRPREWPVKRIANCCVAWPEFELAGRVRVPSCVGHGGCFKLWPTPAAIEVAAGSDSLAHPLHRPRP